MKNIIIWVQWYLSHSQECERLNGNHLQLFTMLVMINRGIHIVYPRLRELWWTYKFRLVRIAFKRSSLNYFSNQST